MQQLIRILLISSFVIFLTSCNSKTVKVLKSEKVNKDGTEMLYGKISAAQLYFDFPDWKQNEESYQPYKPAIDSLKLINGNFMVEIFIGTWCSDSKREVPAFLKIVEVGELKDNLKIKMWAIDRQKHLENGLAVKRGIERVPTFIFYKNDLEFGRIVETPENLLEQDILKILTSTNGA